jgi:hypothetical protein
MAVTAIGAAAASLPLLVAARHSCRVQPAVAAAPRSDCPELPVPPALQPHLAKHSRRRCQHSNSEGNDRTETTREWLCLRFFPIGVCWVSRGCVWFGPKGMWSCDGVVCEGDLGILRDSVGSGRGQVERVPSNPGRHEHGSAARRSVLSATEILFSDRSGNSTHSIGRQLAASPPTIPFAAAPTLELGQLGNDEGLEFFQLD